MHFGIQHISSDPISICHLIHAQVGRPTTSYPVVFTSIYTYSFSPDTILSQNAEIAQNMQKFNMFNCLITCYRREPCLVSLVLLVLRSELALPEYLLAIVLEQNVGGNLLALVPVYESV
jgi:hypothetical protein